MSELERLALESYLDEILKQGSVEPHMLDILVQLLETPAARSRYETLSPSIVREAAARRVRLPEQKRRRHRRSA